MFSAQLCLPLTLLDYMVFFIQRIYKEPVLNGVKMYFAIFRHFLTWYSLQFYFFFDFDIWHGMTSTCHISSKRNFGSRGAKEVLILRIVAKCLRRCVACSKETCEKFTHMCEIWWFKMWKIRVGCICLFVMYLCVL